MSKVIVDEIQTDTTDGNVRIIPNGSGALEVKGDGSSNDAKLQLNCYANSHGVKIKSPAHSVSQEYTMILPDNNIAADKYLKVKSIVSGSGTSAVGQLEFADVSSGGVTSDSQYNTVGGTNAGDSFSGTDAINNTLIGYDAGTAITSSDNNTAIGFEALKSQTDGGGNGQNTAVGAQALKTTTGFQNVAVGCQALEDATGNVNTAVGFQACFEISSGHSNCAFGYSALRSQTTASANSAFGYMAGYSNTSGTLNTFIGYYAGMANTEGQKNTFLGYDAGKAVTTGEGNVFVGAEAGASTTTTNDNVGIGRVAMKLNTTGEDNVAIGPVTLYQNTTGDKNVAIGYRSQYWNDGGNYNVSVGADALYDVTTGTNNICIGYNAGSSSSPSGEITTQSHRICLGDNNITNIYCADTSISSSDSRDKTDVTSFTIGLNWIEALRPVTYRWDRRTWYGTDDEPFGTPDGSKKRQRLHIGFLAQEALEVEKANGYGNSNDDSLLINLTDDGMSYGMKYERLVPILVNAIKELSTRVKALEAG